MAQPDLSTAEPSGVDCWCCGREFAEIDVVRLGARPEVAICTGCTYSVKRRAVAKEDAHRRGPASRARSGIGRVRQWVIDHHWHERGPLGAALRRLDRLLP